MSRFTDLQDWSLRSGRYGFVTQRELAWEIGTKGSCLWLVVPVGFGFDVSVPRALRWLVDPLEPRYRKAAALHDFALASGWDRVSAAAAFSEALRADDVGRMRRLALVFAVILWHWQ